MPTKRKIKFNGKTYEIYPCAVCGREPEIDDFMQLNRILCQHDSHSIVFYGIYIKPAIKSWNKLNGRIK